jgi:hypothetical protein
MRTAWPLLVVLALLAGCAAAVRDAPVTPASVASADGMRVSLVAIAANGGEPSIGATRNGDLYVAGAFSPDPTAPVDERLYKSTDGGATWRTVGDAIHDARLDEDPWMWADPRTDRVYNAPNTLACSWLEWSDDGGATWDFNPAGGCGLPGNDHQKLSGGPPPKGVATSGYPSVLYYAYNSFRPAVGLEALDAATSQGGNEGVVVDVSYDGGKSWSLPVVAHPADKCHAGINGMVAVAGDGTAYLPSATCKGVDVEVSKDGGKTWGRPVSIDGAGSLATLAIDPAVAVDDAGNAYLAWPGKDGAAYLSVSRDNGTTWSEPTRASPPEVKETIHVVMVAGAEGRVALAYYGTTSDPATWPKMDPSNAPDSVAWHLYVAESVDALALAPTFATKQVTPDDDPAQRGCIWLQGGVNSCRNIGDFIGMTQVKGRPFVVYVDGCDKCADAASSHGTNAVLARLDAGPSLLGGDLAPPTEAAATPR